jgi:Fic family protein
MVRGLHAMLMKGVPEIPKCPIKAGYFRDATDEMEATGVKYLTRHMSPAWRVGSDVATLLEDAERGALGAEGMHAAGRFHYRFVRIHPFCDGNGRMARALSTFLLAKEHPDILTFEKPLNLIMLEHREDYVGILEYCDGIYEDLKDADMSEEERLRWAEEPFSDFHARAFLKAYREHNESEHRKLEQMGVSLPPFPAEPPGLYDLNLKTIMELHPWDETMREAAVLSSRR